ncbi:hypothetical protein N798_15970 [Knoellia flava TL1]|uniref:Uncharacterized protein n=1 Tax=Knoellia flava TL1 TaxID=1385518 RepID=A0ABR4XAG5_9MICO|nr:hypothetical protein N798_15970 [Knoellia flava TL1]
MGATATRAAGPPDTDQHAAVAVRKVPGLPEGRLRPIVAA